MTDEEKFALFEALCSLLAPQGAELWQRYFRAERENVRKQALAILGRFAAHLRTMEADRLDAWIAGYCEAIRETGLTGPRHWNHWTPIRFSLLSEVVLPRLIEGYHRGERAAYARLVILSDHFYGTGPASFCEKHDFPDNQIVFLEEALLVNPEDDLALQKLVSHRYATLEYLIHELPGGVLMDELQPELDWIARFETLVERAGREEEFRGFIERVRSYVIAWDDFRARIDRYESFAAYLYCHKIPF